MFSRAKPQVARRKLRLRSIALCWFIREAIAYTTSDDYLGKTHLRRNDGSCHVRMHSAARYLYNHADKRQQRQCLNTESRSELWITCLLCCPRNFLYDTHTCPLYTSSGCRRREAQKNWSKVKPEKAAPVVTGTALKTTDPVTAASRR